MLNRALLFAAIDDAVATSADGEAVGLLLLRSQRMRDVERQLGYGGTDAYVAEMEAGIAGAMRPDDTVVRIGDADFAVLLRRLRGRNHAVLAAAKLVRTLQVLALDGREIRPAFAVGAAAFPGDGDGAEPLCRAADAACLLAAETEERFALIDAAPVLPAFSHDDLREAIGANRLALHFQPIVDLRGDGPPRYEALARWIHPVHGPVSPAVFVKVAEETGLSGPLTRWSINTALRHLVDAQRRVPGAGVSINIAVEALQQRGFVDQVRDLLAFWGVSPSTVILEVTETGLMRDMHASARILHDLREIGVGIAIDDFGTGYASMSYLRQLPATELKIDGSFVQDMARDPRAARLVRTMVDLSHHLGLEVVAEGVEDAEALELLRGMGCDFAQGYHLGRPGPAEAQVAQAGDPAV